MEVVFEREVFGKGQRAARCKQTLDGGITGLVDEGDHARPAPVCFEGVEEKCRFALGDAHGTEYYHKFPGIVPGCGLAHDQAGQFVGRQAGPEKDGQFLSPDQRVEAVDRGDAGFNEIAGVIAGNGVDGRAADVELDSVRQGREPVDRSAHPVKPAADDVFGRHNTRGLLAQGDGAAFDINALRSLKHLYDGALGTGFEDLALAAFAGFEHEVENGAGGKTVSVAQEHERPGDLGDVPVFPVDEVAARGPVPLLFVGLHGAYPFGVNSARAVFMASTTSCRRFMKASPGTSRRRARSSRTGRSRMRARVTPFSSFSRQAS
jgi:hypothetical protein